MDFNEMLNDVIEGFIIMAKILLSLIVIAGTAIGIFSAVLVAGGIIPFSWLFIPCWIIDLFIIAGAVGSASNDW